jgi:septal ring factor EnvC (AmiA/AmiB activator)
MSTVTKATRSLPAALAMTLLLFMTALVLPTTLTSTASAGPLADARSDLTDAREAMAQLQAKLDDLGGTYQDAVERKADLDEAIAVLQKDETSSRKDLDAMQKQLAQRLVNLYKKGGGDSNTGVFLEILFQEKDLVTVLDRMELLGKVATQDQDFYSQINKHLVNVDKQQADLGAKKAEQAKLVGQIKTSQGDLENRLNEVSAEYKQLKQRVATLEEEARRAAEAEKARIAALAARTTGQSPSSSSSSSPAPQAVNGFVFPVDGAHSFRDNWGDYRSAGGWHLGIDISAARGTPLVAVVSGTILITPYDSISGLKVWLYGDNGTKYFYCHLEAIADGISGGVSVRAGQVVGYNGDSGNASGGPCHLHFQMHPGGGSPVNPYYVLRASE